MTTLPHPVSCVSENPEGEGTRRYVAEYLARLDAIAATGEEARQIAANVRHLFRHYACPGVYNEDYDRHMGCGQWIDNEATLCPRHQHSANLAAREANARYFEKNEEYGW